MLNHLLTVELYGFQSNFMRQNSNVIQWIRQQIQGAGAEKVEKLTYKGSENTKQAIRSNTYK